MRRAAFGITTAIIAAIFLVLLTRTAIPQTGQSGNSSVTALVGGRLIDGYGGKPLENSVVIVQTIELGRLRAREVLLGEVHPATEVRTDRIAPTVLLARLLLGGWRPMNLRRPMAWRRRL